MLSAEDNIEHQVYSDEKLDQTASYINQQLVGLGYPAPFDFQGKDCGRILACIYSLLQQRHKEAYYQADLKVIVSLK
jgi:hypothetical protein